MPSSSPSPTIRRVSPDRLLALAVLMTARRLVQRITFTLAGLLAAFVDASAGEPPAARAGRADPVAVASPAPPEAAEEAAAMSTAADAAPTAPADPPVTEPAPEKPRDYYVRARGYRIVPETDPPRYVRDAPKTGYSFLQSADWLDIGLEHRTRFEYRQNSFLRTPQKGKDYPFLLRTRLYLGVKDKLDPFRFVVELQDSRWENSQYPSTNREVNEFEPIQMYGELYFKDLLGADRPLYVRGGRMAFELLDRRLIANNEFRNTTNNFQGVRVRAGQETNDWFVDLLALQPINRLMYEFDETVEGQWFYGIVGSIQRWSDVATVQPYWLGLTQFDSETAPTEDDRFSIQTLGTRAYGIVGKTGWDWDVDLAYQFGSATDDRQQNAWASAYEVGYTVESWSWKPRFSGFFGFGSGDLSPNDDEANTFNALFGFNQPWSRNDYFSWDNAIMPKVRVEFRPHADVQVEAGYGAFWLASSKAPWARAQLSDPTGKSGSWLGNEYDVRIRYRLWKHIFFDTSYARFDPGTFPKNLGKGLSSNFVYFQVSLQPYE